MLGVQDPNLASSVVFDPECTSWANCTHPRTTSLWRSPLLFFLSLNQDLVLVPSDFKSEFRTCCRSCGVSLAGKPDPCGPYPGCGGADVWDGSCYRHRTIWSFSASGSYELIFLLCGNKGCFVCTAESKTTRRQFPWYSGFAETWQEEKSGPNTPWSSNQPAPWSAPHDRLLLEQSRKTSQIFLSKWRTMEGSPDLPVGRKKATGRKPGAPSQPAFLPWALPPRCRVPASHLHFLSISHR